MTIHPSFKSLLAHQDQQLNSKGTQKVGRHLAVCSRCCREADQLAAERETVDAVCRDAAQLETPPFSQVFETIRVKVAEKRLAENHAPHFWRTPLVGFALAVILLMSFNTLVFTGFILHPLYAVPAPTLLPVIFACMVPAYLAARRAARRLTFTHKTL